MPTSKRTDATKRIISPASRSITTVIVSESMFSKKVDLYIYVTCPLFEDSVVMVELHEKKLARLMKACLLSDEGCLQPGVRSWKGSPGYLGI